MALVHFSAPDLTDLSYGGTQLLFLQAQAYTNDSKLVLVKATFSDDGAPQPGSLQYGYFLYDVASESYIANLNSLLVGTEAAASAKISQMVLAGSKDNWQLVAEVSEAQGSHLYHLDSNGVVSTDLVQNITGEAYSIEYEQLGITEDGRFLAVQTTSAFLAADNQPDTNDSPDIYLFDLLNSASTRVSYVGNSEVMQPTYLVDMYRHNNGDLSIAFVTDAAFVSPNSVDTNGGLTQENASSDLYLWRMQVDAQGLVGTPSFDIVSGNTSGVASGYIDKEASVAITAAGTYFTSAAADLVVADFNNSSDIFLHSDSGVVRVSLHNGNELSQGASLVDASSTGTGVLGLTQSSELLAGALGQQAVHFAKADGEVTLVSSNGDTPANDWVAVGLLAPNGGTASFSSSANNLAIVQNVSTLGDLFLQELSAVNNSPTGAVTITGTATQGETLTVSNTLADVDGLGVISYQWIRGGELIADATASQYVLTMGDVDQVISVNASYTDSFGTKETISSESTTSVIGVYQIQIDVEHPLFRGGNVAIDSYQVSKTESGVTTQSTELPKNLGDRTNQVLAIEVAPSSDIVITPIKQVTDTEASDITVYDALDALKIAIGLDIPSSVYGHQLIAADIDQSGDVTVYDALAILKAAIGLSTSIQPKWAFINRDYYKEIPEYEVTKDDIRYEESMTISDINQDVFSEFETVLLGDVDMSYVVEVV